MLIIHRAERNEEQTSWQTDVRSLDKSRDTEIETVLILTAWESRSDDKRGAIEIASIDWGEKKKRERQALY